MKKTLGLILALALALGCILSFASCKNNKGPTIYDLAASANPTKTVTLVDYVGADGVTLTGDYAMEIEGNNSIFTFSYERYRTIEDGANDESYDRIKTVSGVVYYKDGKFSTDGEAWEAEAPSPSSIRFDLKPEYLSNVEINEDGTKLVAQLSAENAVNVFGTNLNAQGNISLTIETNGVSLSRVVISCNTVDGATITVNTTYTYNAITLTFPGDAE